MSKNGSSRAWRNFLTAEALAQGLARDVAQELEQAAAARGEALLAVSGGTTPLLFFQALSNQEIPWSKVTVTLVDERFVAPNALRSNERLASENLLRNKAAKARLAGLFSKGATVEDAAALAEERLRGLPFPIDVAVLGMGLDGHTASFFPDAHNLAALLDTAAAGHVLPVHAPSAGEPRLTLRLARLVEARFIALHIEGAAKRDVLLAALGQAADTAPPVRALFEHARKPVHIYWAPKKDELP